MRNYASNIDNRMFDFQKWYDTVARLLPNDCKIVEVGVSSGASAIYLAEAILNLGKRIDTFYWVDSMAYGKYNQMKEIYQHIIKSDLGNYVDVIPLDSVKASKLFNGNSLDFVYLDSSHTYSDTKKEIRNWYSKIKDDGILSGHDMTSEENPGVAKAVREMIPERIKRATIDEPDHFQEFNEEQFLFTEATDKNLGVWFCYKKFYYSIK